MESCEVLGSGSVKYVTREKWQGTDVAVARMHLHLWDSEEILQYEQREVGNKNRNLIGCSSTNEDIFMLEVRLFMVLCSTFLSLVADALNAIESSGSSVELFDLILFCRKLE